MVPIRKRVFGSVVVAALLVAVSLVSIPRGAFAADVDEEPGAKSSGKSDIADQAEDKDRPKDPSLLDKNAADAAVAKKKQEDAGPPFYEKWQFWAITGGVVVAIVAAAIVVPKISHQVNGGDVRPCNPMFVQCVGAGH
jgi:hypothetical protein